MSDISEDGFAILAFLSGYRQPVAAHDVAARCPPKVGTSNLAARMLPLIEAGLVQRISRPTGHYRITAAGLNASREHAIKMRMDARAALNKEDEE